MRRLGLLLLPLLAGCASDGVGPEAAVPQVQTWRELATDQDRQRLHDWRDAWVEALRKARLGRHGAEVAAEGLLLNPDAAIAGSTLPPGEYRCRTIKIGAKSEGLLNYIAYPPFLCRVSDPGPGPQSFVKVTGSQRPVGRIFPENNRRAIFLGTLQLGDEQGVMRYGHDRERDMAGIVERLGPGRWRIVFPYPHFESTVDVLELVPSTEGSQ
jgi:hypothetical protein